MGATVEVQIARVSGAKFECRNAAGNTAFIDGPPDLGGVGEGVRPMEMLLMSLAGCSALDVIHILEKKQGEPLEGLAVKVKGTRADAVPAVYTDVELQFEAMGAIARNKLERAVALSMEKYCSVARMISAGTRITWTVQGGQ